MQGSAALQQQLADTQQQLQAAVEASQAAQVQAEQAERDLVHTRQKLAEMELKAMQGLAAAEQQQEAVQAASQQNESLSRQLSQIQVRLGLALATPVSEPTYPSSQLYALSSPAYKVLAFVEPSSLLLPAALLISLTISVPVPSTTPPTTDTFIGMPPSRFPPSLQSLLLESAEEQGQAEALRRQNSQLLARVAELEEGAGGGSARQSQVILDLQRENQALQV